VSVTDTDRRRNLIAGRPATDVAVVGPLRVIGS
jgi:hypothetical protein